LITLEKLHMRGFHGNNSTIARAVIRGKRLTEEDQTLILKKPSLINRLQW